MGFHARAQEVLACADYLSVAFTGSADRIRTGLGGRAVYLYVVLMRRNIFLGQLRGTSAQGVVWRGLSPLTTEMLFNHSIIIDLD